VIEKNFALLVWLEDVTRMLRSGQKITLQPCDTEMFDKILLELERVYETKQNGTH
jgi:hypothetical protein